MSLWGFGRVAKDPVCTLPQSLASRYATEIDAAAPGSRFATPVSMSPSEDTGCHSVSAMGHHASRRSSRAFPVDQLIYAPSSELNP